MTTPATVNEADRKAAEAFFREAHMTRDLLARHIAQARADGAAAERERITASLRLRADHYRLIADGDRRYTARATALEMFALSLDSRSEPKPLQPEGTAR